MIDLLIEKKEEEIQIVLLILERYYDFLYELRERKKFKIFLESLQTQTLPKRKIFSSVGERNIIEIGTPLVKQREGI